jgi:hypothetical protein
MRRKLQFVVSMIAIVLLIRPLDCLAFGDTPRETAKCCLKGKCAPTAKADDCCRAAVPDSSQPMASRAADYSSPLIDLAAVRFTNAVPALVSELHAAAVRHPPPLNRVPYTLPLLI